MERKTKDNQEVRIGVPIPSYDSTDDRVEDIVGGLSRWDSSTTPPLAARGLGVAVTPDEGASQVLSSPSPEGGSEGSRSRAGRGGSV